ncbi:MAG: hypothetical protein K8S54_20485 [Spirochaetia bacterium]|nr:hypothetical protein [Spirochaetia bacterium]
MALDNLTMTDFEIEATLDGSTIELTWKGAIHAPNPEDFLDPYFETVVLEAGKSRQSIRCNFVPLEYMNSASIPPLIALLRALAEKGIKGEFIYDSNRKVQAASFRALDVIARKSKFTTVRGV